ncbi:MAG TPA: cation:proton antiporter [Salinivirga sp.]|uniref:cation:proton antiporter n=1 Tax=Salinivirga sp. TaxID=1970192 RepID=UPI002B463D7B|nr:cation:proton antiporter [Salinivirga sp.]HKK59792.1 cation:proton antiporter [Salinivirga sp.]
MSEEIITGLATIVILGISAQWVAWRLRLPSILLLLLFGFLAGPVFGILDPDAVMGQSLLPVVTMSVAVILFEGGLSLRVKELKSVGGTVLKLISLGVFITWILTSLAAFYILELNLRISILLGAVLVVTGPTVINPLLAHIRPKGNVGKVLKWEGIIIDPVGALLAVLVFEALLVEKLEQASSLIALGIFKTIIFGGGIGIGLALLLVYLLKRYWIPDFLQETVTFMLVIAAFILSNQFQEESGLFAATVMGIVLDNQKIVTIKNIVEFKENLVVLIISSLFILLAARLDLESFTTLNWHTILFVTALILIIRPLSVFLSAIGSGLNLREKLFLSWMAPRGIVAAAVASVFAFKLAENGFQQTERIVPITFIVIVSTVTIYGLTATWVAKKLKVAQTDPQGILFIGAFKWVRELAATIKEQGFNVALIDTSPLNVQRAQKLGLSAYHGNVLSEAIADEIELDGIGKLIALTPNDEVNSLAALHFSETFDSEHLFQLQPNLNEGKGYNAHTPKHLRGRFAFSNDFYYQTIAEFSKKKFKLKTLEVSDKTDYDDLILEYKGNIAPLFIIDKEHRLKVFTEDLDWEPIEGEKLIAMVKS